MMPTGPSGATCPECGKAVPPHGAKLCPHCGYPLLLDRRPVVEQQPRKIVHKPTDQPDLADLRRTMVRPMHPAPQQRPPMGPPGPQPMGPPRWGPEPARVLGPHCPSCRHPNPPNRKRCEVCGTELWPGAASPSGPARDETVVYRPRRRRPWWQIALFIAIPLVIIGGVWALAVFL